MEEKASKIHHCVVMKTSRGVLYTVCWQNQSDCLQTFTGVSGWASECDGDGFMENIELFFFLKLEIISEMKNDYKQA